jgi:hypothetical protein
MLTMTRNLTALVTMLGAALLPRVCLADEAAADPDQPGAEQSEEDAGMDEWRPGTPGRIQLGVLLGFGGRVDDPPLYELTDPLGLAFGAAIDLFLSNRVTLGVSYEHLDLGKEESGLTPVGSVTIVRDLNTAWLSLRIYPVQEPAIGAYLKIAGGLAWQSAELTGSVWDPTQPGRQLQLSCEGAHTPGMALRAELGIDVELTEGLRMPLAFHFDNYGLSSDVLDGCVPGAGSSAVLGLRSGFTFETGL